MPDSGELGKKMRGLLESLLGGSASAGGNADPSDDASDLQYFDNQTALKQTLGPQSDCYGKAAQRAALGLYDVCENCGGGIEPERRKVLPETTLCGSCAKRNSGSRRPTRYQA